MFFKKYYVIIYAFKMSKDDQWNYGNKVVFNIDLIKRHLTLLEEELKCYDLGLLSFLRIPRSVGKYDKTIKS